MDFIELIEGEIYPLLRAVLQRFIGLKFKKQNNNTIEILLKTSIRVISSLIAIQIFNQVKLFTNYRKYTSYVMIIVFLYFLIEENRRANDEELAVYVLFPQERDVEVAC